MNQGWREELRTLLALSGPIVVAQAGMMLMGAVDTMMVGRLNETSLAAVAISHAVSITFAMMAIGVLLAVNTTVAQAHGAGDREAIGSNLQQGFVLAVLLAVPLSLVLWDLGPLLTLLDQQPALVPEARAYARGLVPGLLAMLLFATLRQGLQGVGSVMPLLFAVVVGNAINVLANYALIFGHLGFPAFGSLGSAYATSLCRWIMLVTMFLLSGPILGPYWRGFDHGVRDLSGYVRLVSIGVPISFKLLLEMGVFTAVALVMGRLGVQEAAGHQIAINLASLSFMVPLGVAIATTTRVGNAIGRGDPEGARRVARLALGIGGAVMTVSAALFGFLPAGLARLYTDEPAAVAMAGSLLPIAALFQVFDGLQVVSGGILRGAADTAIPAILAFCGYWLLALPLGLYLAYSRDMGAVGLWWGLTAGLAVAATLLVGRVFVRLRRPLEAV